MSQPLLTRVFELRLPPNQKYVLIALACHAAADGTSQISQGKAGGVDRLPHQLCQTGPGRLDGRGLGRRTRRLRWGQRQALRPACRRG